VRTANSLSIKIQKYEEVYSGVVYSTGRVWSVKVPRWHENNLSLCDVRKLTVNPVCVISETTNDCQLKCEQVKYYDSSSPVYRSEFAQSTLVISGKDL